jgi:hypothetical protein
MSDLKFTLLHQTRKQINKIRLWLVKAWSEKDVFIFLTIIDSDYILPSIKRNIAKHVIYYNIFLISIRLLLKFQ